MQWRPCLNWKKTGGEGCCLVRSGNGELQVMRCVRFSLLISIASVNSGQCDCLQEPVWEREPGWNCGGWYCGNGGEYDCGSDIL